MVAAVRGKASPVVLVGVQYGSVDPSSPGRRVAGF